MITRVLARSRSAPLSSLWLPTAAPLHRQILVCSSFGRVSATCRVLLPMCWATSCDAIVQIKNQLKSTDQIKTNPVKSYSKDSQSNKIEITSFQDLIVQANKEKEIELKYDLERNVKLVSFNKGKIDISFNEKLNKNFIKNLTEKLLLWTGWQKR